MLEEFKSDWLWAAETARNGLIHAAEAAKHGITHVIDYFPSVPTAAVQKGLLVATTGCAILSAIPPCRLAGSLALRTIALLSAGANCVGDSETQIDKITQIAKIALVALGLVAVLATSPFLMAASVTADLGLQVFEMGRAVLEGNHERALCHLGAVLIDTFAVGAILTGSWGLMLTASLVSTVVMGAFAMKAFVERDRDSSNILDGFCYLALAGLGLTTALTVAFRPALYRRVPIKEYYTLYNDSSSTKYYTTGNGQLVTILAPKTGGIIEIPVQPQKGCHILRWDTYSPYRHGYVGATYVERQSVLISPAQPPLAATEFPKLPIGGTAIVTKDLR